MTKPGVRVAVAGGVTMKGGVAVTTNTFYVGIRLETLVFARPDGIRSLPNRPDYQQNEKRELITKSHGNNVNILKAQ